ncbi:MAG: hypothetical protein GY703_00940 [Gammaproteobacteria bacterium]|nr:hypothetical protein [Gammaproteobacteria bacterium]
MATQYFRLPSTGRLLLLVTVLCLAVPASAADDREDSGRNPQAKVDQGRAKTNETRSSQSVSPPRTFKPSEKISADSAVSFPVDI